MRPFDYYNVTSVAQAVSLLAKHPQKAAILAGGSDLLAMMKDRLEGPKLKLPTHLIDIKGIKELNYIKEQKNGVRIGAGTVLSDIVASDPQEAESLFDPARDKVYRHPTFYAIPEDVKNL